MVDAALGTMFAIQDPIPEVTEYYSVLRLLNRYGSDIDLFGSYLFNDLAGFTVVFSEDIWGDIYLKEKLELNEEKNLEEKLALEKSFGVETEAKSNPERELRSEAGYELKADFQSRKELEESASREPKMIRANALLNWAQFLCDLGLDVNDMSVFQHEDQILTPLMMNVLLESSTASGNVVAVLLLCILGADVSIRDPDRGYQALHLVFSAKYSVDTSLPAQDLVYILIHYGGADPWATTFDGFSPTDLAYLNGWMKEWITACERCGISKETLLSKENERQLKSLYLGDGESTAIDTHDLTPISLEAFKTLKRRRPVAGDRLME